ncbi:MAG: virulence factor SrfB [Desulfovibrionaceae bacterium]|nr:virulence factor SrfB [Desulfovibrionaceae bacterium]
MQYPKYNERISLIPGGCPQLLDFLIELETIGRMRRTFEERVDNGKTRLFPLIEIDGEEVDVFEHGEPKGETYTLDAQKTIAPWLGQWFPIPFLREREQVWEESGRKRVDAGPSNWARARIVPGQKAGTLALVLAFDMQVEPLGDDQVYGALCPEDVNAHAQFRLAWDIRDNGWFLNEAWVDGWLKEIWRSGKKRKGPDEGPVLEHLASYLTVLEFVNVCIRDSRVYVINPAKLIPVDVDFVLDIGNSRTTGILVETRAQSVTNLNNSYLLQLRDMDAPENIYTDPFETRVEFSEISFGSEAYSRRSGRRTPAFVWPSPVRIGPEAARLSTESVCAEGATGMSSPKRYLWDERDWKQSWRFNTRGQGEPYVTRGLLAQQVNSSGTPLCCMQDRRFRNNKILRKQETECAFESLFTRSSLMMFLLVEVIQQALLTINSPGQRIRRESPDVPRRLRQVIFTVPAGMPLAEQRIYRRWAHWAVRVLWETLGWMGSYVENSKNPPAELKREYRRSPLVRCNWDEATSTQLVYIYNEISRKFQGDARLFCTLKGRKRPEVEGHPAIRVATIDIGGGTTDLSVTTFELLGDAGSSARMRPHPVFHDGFNLAGDDVLCAVVRDHVLSALGEAMGKAGVPDTHRALNELFGRDVIDSSQESRNHRIQCIRQVAVPVGLTLLSAYENANLRSGSGRIACRFRDCFALETEENEKNTRISLPSKPYPLPNRDALRYVESYVESYGAEDFSVLDVPLIIDPALIDETVRSVLKDILANLCEVIYRLDCDVLLLTGRPSSWQAILDMILSHLPVPPDRIIAMGKYRVGTWYPFADALGNVTDPKTTVVVGAILCALAEGQLEGFSFDPESLSLHSTAKYIGEMELNGQIRAPKVWFDVDVQASEERTYQRSIVFGGPIAVGFRQLAVERWTTTRFYILEFENEDVRHKYAQGLPFTVTLELRVQALEEDERTENDTERDEGEFTILEVIDCNGNPVHNALSIRLQTLPRDEGFWLDTGIVYL